MSESGCDHDWSPVAPNGMRWCLLCNDGQMQEPVTIQQFAEAMEAAVKFCPGCGGQHPRRDVGAGTCSCCSHPHSSHADDGCTFESCNCAWRSQPVAI